MIDLKYGKIKRAQIIAVCFAISAIMVSCAHNEQSVDTAAATPKTPIDTKAVSSSISVNQINTSTQPLSAPQIKAASPDTAQLTVEQLRTFVDRCMPHSQTPPPSGLDCSEINLRMQRLLRDDDKVIEALVTLGQLGRNDSLARTLDDLNDGQSGNTFTGGAIAGGLINGAVPANPPPIDPPPELQDFLQENGLSVNQGIISRLPQ